MDSPVPQKPVIFLKPLGAICYHGSTIKLPEESNEIHHEAELLVAIGKKGLNIPVEKASDYIAGYGIGIDFTARDLQAEAKRKGLPWTISKGFEHFAPISTFVPAHNVPNIENVEFKLTVNHEVRQSGNSSEMIFSVARLIAYLSSVCTLFPGDLIFTGTPDGVGPVKSGDTLHAELEHYTELSVSVH